MKRRAIVIAVSLLSFALLAILLMPHANYRPGPLMAAHADLSPRCASCHQPWHGPTNQQCIDCHGDFTATNPHGAVTVSDTSDGGLIPGHVLASFDDSLSCRSCHTEHRGRDVNPRVAAAFACTFCHEHPSIMAVARHKSAMSRPAGEGHLFKKPFSHIAHAFLMSVSTLDCKSCHLLTPTAPGQPVKFSLKWATCGQSGCHTSPQEPEIGLPAAIGTSPVTVGYLRQGWIKHINAVFVHSPAHLRFKCAECHADIGKSKDETDADARAIKRCFSCHAHQPPGPAVAGVASHSSGLADVSFMAEASAATVPPAPAQNRVVKCGQCHLFHRYGPGPILDFPKAAPATLPHSGGQFTLTAYTLTWVTGPGGARTLSFVPVKLTPWGIGLIALVLSGVLAVGLLRFLPKETDPRTVVSGVAPQRTPEVPELDDSYQSNVPGLYIVGEAAGTASINFAMRSGRQVVQVVAGLLRHQQKATDSELYDVAIVGCGPSGLGATATAKAMGLQYCTLEKMTAASTIRNYPRHKFVQATPIDIDEYGSFFLEGDNSKEGLIKEWEKIIGSLQLTVNEREEVVGITQSRGVFELKTAAGHLFKARYVVLAIGVRGSPRHLNMPGEAPDRVFYNLIEPEEFQHKNIVVVGGGNAGAEVAQALSAKELGNKVAYSFRDAALTTVTRENAEKISALQQAGALTLYPASALEEIKPGKAVLAPVAAKPGAPAAGGLEDKIELDNDVIFAMIGAELPTRFLKSVGVKMVRKGR